MRQRRWRGDRQKRCRVTHDPRSPTKVEPRTKPKEQEKKKNKKKKERERKKEKKKTEEKIRRKKHNLEISSPPSAHQRSTLFLIDAFFLQLLFVPRPRLPRLHQGTQIKGGKTGDRLLRELASPRSHFVVISGDLEIRSLFMILESCDIVVHQRSRNKQLGWKLEWCFFFFGVAFQGVLGVCF